MQVLLKVLSVCSFDGVNEGQRNFRCPCLRCLLIDAGKSSYIYIEERSLQRREYIMEKEKEP